MGAAEEAGVGAPEAPAGVEETESLKEGILMLLLDVNWEFEKMTCVVLLVLDVV